MGKLGLHSEIVWTCPWLFQDADGGSRLLEKLKQLHWPKSSGPDIVLVPVILKNGKAAKTPQD